MPEDLSHSPDIEMDVFVGGAGLAMSEAQGRKEIAPLSASGVLYMNNETDMLAIDVK